MHTKSPLVRRSLFQGSLWLGLLVGFSGCQGDTPSLPLDSEVAHASLEKAMQAWVDGKRPEDLKPEITIGDVAWDRGQQLVSFEIVTGEETTAGSNIHIPVKRKLMKDGKVSESQVRYIVGTSPVITIFPQ